MTVKEVNDLKYRGYIYRVKPRNTGSTFGAWSSELGTYLSFQNYFKNESYSSAGLDKLNRRSLPMHPHTRQEWVQLSDITSARLHWTWPDGTWAENQYLGPAQICNANADMPESYYPSADELSRKALARLFDNLSASKGSAAVSMAEIGKTAEMLGDTARRLATAYSALRHGRISDFSDALGITISNRRASALRKDWKGSRFGSSSSTREFAGQTWLEFTYGWKPLISDVYTQAENLSNYLTKRQNVIREARGSAKGLEERTELLTNDVNWINTKKSYMFRRVGYVVRYKLPDGGASIAQTFGLQNPAIVAWEIIPFSFVADWFLPIGNFLEQLTATSGLTFVDGVKTQKSRASSLCSTTGGKPRTDQGGTLTPTVTGGGTIRNNLFQSKFRWVLIDFPSVRIPAFKNPLSISHALSGIALLQAVFHGNVKRYVSR